MIKKLWKYFALLFFISLIFKLVFFITHTPFAQDQVRDVLFIRDIISNGKYFIPFGPSTSVGSFFLPPLYYYLQLFSHLVFLDNFYSMDLFVISVESLTPLLIFILTLRITKNKLISFFSALIYICAPGVLIASHAWNPNLVPFFSTLFVTSFLYYFFDKKNYWLVSAIVSFAVLLNLHFQWFVLLPFLVIITSYSLLNIKKTWKALLLSVIISLFLFSPYLMKELSSGFENTKSAVTFLTQEEIIYERVRKPVYVAFFFPNYYQRIIVGNLFNGHWSEQYEKFSLPMILGSILFFVVMGLSVKLSFDQYRKSNSKRLITSQGLNKNIFFATYLAIFFSMAIILRIYKGDKPDYYLYIFLQFFAVLISSSIFKVTNTKSNLIKILPFIFILILELWAISKLQIKNSYLSYKNITNEIIDLSKNYSVNVAPTNQELILPLKYFLDEEYFNYNKKESTQYYVLFCYSYQNCKDYKPNTNDPKNLFKYDNINPVDFSYTWNDLYDEGTFGISEGSYSALFVRVKE